ncbi:unnamed protein product [Orchesella dallaii]|uniref:Angiogenic factor with G patch and FHA domains 1 n=1 Tax=Orchesella dallaii TaxID=48710 RepID=A0ABP1RCB6_9HEXA
MNIQQEITRSQSVPVLNRDEAVLTKIQEHDGLISLMQTQIEFQSEVIAKHDKKFEHLHTTIEDLKSKLKELEDAFSKRLETQKAEKVAKALWSSDGADDNQTSIADIVKQTAEQTLGTESGFLYDDKLGLYFDQASGYYYDPIKQLYYNGHTKTYYSYDATTNTYQVHEPVKRKKGNKNKKPKQNKRVDRCASPSSPRPINVPEPAEPDDLMVIEDGSPIDQRSGSNYSNPSSPVKPHQTLSDMEEGELSSSNSSNDAELSSNKSDDSSGDEVESDNGNQQTYPPCIRAVVQSALDSDKSLKKGTLFLVPYTGGTIGCSGSKHAILLPTVSVDKLHAKIHYQDFSSNEDSMQDGKYFVTDVGSKNGTYLNKTRLSESGVPSEPHELVHGSTLQVGDVILLLHMHPGDFTCGHCEPGLVIQKEPMYEYTSGENSEKVRRSEIKKIKKKYCLDRKNENSKAKADMPIGPYADRAKSRRAKVGSDNPFAKTEVASVNMPIKETNKGFKMLKKMGWAGESLGTSENAGLTEPIKCEVKTNRGGLGLQDSSAISMPVQENKKRSKHLAKTMERYNEAKTSNAFQEDNV